MIALGKRSYHEWTTTLALWTRTGLHLEVLRLSKWAQHVATFVAIVFDDTQLRKNAGSGAHHASRTHQLVQMDFSARQ